MRGKNLTEKIIVIICTWFYSGLIPPPKFMKGMAGTYGSFFALPICYFAVSQTKIFIDSVGYGGIVLYCHFLSLIFFAGYMFAKTSEKILGPLADYKGRIKTHDLNQTVIDEVFGMLITCLPIVYFNQPLLSTKGILLFLLAFGYFRLFDIIKLWPVKIFDRMLNSFGIMMDDGVAGVQAAILLVITNSIYNIFF